MPPAPLLPAARLSPDARRSAAERLLPAAPREPDAANRARRVDGKSRPAP